MEQELVEFDVDSFLDSLDKPSKCKTCNHPEGSFILNKILDAMIERRKQGNLKKTPTQGEILTILQDKTNYPGSKSNLSDHLNNCIKSKWEAARYGRLQS